MPIRLATKNLMKQNPRTELQPTRHIYDKNGEQNRAVDTEAAASSLARISVVTAATPK